MTIEIPNQYLIPFQKAERMVAKSHHVRAECKKRLMNAVSMGNQKSLRKQRYAYFNNHHVKISALYKAGVRKPNIREWDIEAKCFDPFRPLDEPVYWRTLPKRSGGERIICRLAPKLNAAHNMIADVLWAQMDPPEFIYNLKGAGREALVAELLSKLRTGFTHYRVYDVRDCFQNISPNAVKQLKLPRRIIANALDIENLTFERVAKNDATHTDTIHRDTISSTTGECGPTGIIQGSPASNLILADLLKTMPTPPNGDGYVFIYCDDLIVVSKSVEIIGRVETALLGFFNQPSVGPLTLKRKAAGNCGSFEYLGYEFRYLPYTREWEVDLSLSNGMRLVRQRHQEVLDLHVNNPHGIFCDHMHRTRNCLAGYPSLTNPDAAFKAIQNIGPDQLEIDQYLKNNQN